MNIIFFLPQPLKRGSFWLKNCENRLKTEDTEYAQSRKSYLGGGVLEDNSPPVALPLTESKANSWNTSTDKQ